MNHVLSMATRSRYPLFTAKEKLRIIEEAENVGNRERKLYSRLAQKNKTRLTEISRPNRRALRSQKTRHPELEKRLCDYVDDKRQYGCTVTSEMCQMKALAISKELGITCFKATLHLCQEAGSERVLMASSGDWCSMAMANHA